MDMENPQKRLFMDFNIPITFDKKWETMTHVSNTCCCKLVFQNFGKWIGNPIICIICKQDFWTFEMLEPWTCYNFNISTFGNSALLILTFCKFEILKLWNLGTLELWIFETLKRRNEGTKKRRNEETKKQQIVGQ